MMAVDTVTAYLCRMAWSKIPKVVGCLALFAFVRWLGWNSRNCCAM